MRHSFAYDVRLAASSWTSRPALALCANEVLPVPSLSMFQVETVGKERKEQEPATQSESVCLWCHR